LKINLTKDLDPLREKAIQAVDEAVKQKREPYLEAHKAQEYDQMMAEIRRLRAGDTGSYPMLTAERDARVESGENVEATLSSVANQVEDAYNSAVEFNAQLRKARRKAKFLIKHAKSQNEIESIEENTIEMIGKL
jgi:predicted  nucleic acid-binding Zn-ribbon protein